MTKVFVLTFLMGLGMTAVVQINLGKIHIAQDQGIVLDGIPSSALGVE